MRSRIVSVTLAVALTATVLSAPPVNAVVQQVVQSIVATTCTNQFVRSIAATGAGSCASVAIGSDVSGLGTGVATLLAGTSSGSGGPAGTTSPAFTTPDIGAATATTINGATVNNTAWSQTTPTPTACTGSFSSVSSIVRVKTIGKTAFFNVDVTDTTQGTASGCITVAMPFASASRCAIVVFLGATNAVGVGVMDAGSSMNMYNASGTFPTGTRVSGSGVCETT